MGAKLYRPAMVVMVALLTGCAAAPVVSVTRAPVISPTRMTPWESLLGRSRALGPARRTQRVPLLLVLREPERLRQQSAIDAMYDPRSARFGRYQSPHAWDRVFGPPSKGVRRVRRLLGRRGFTTRWQPGQSVMAAIASTISIRRVFGIQLERFVAPNGTHFVASRQTPALPSWMRSAVSGIGTVTNYPDRAVNLIPVNGLSPSGLVQAYDMTPLRRSGFDGSGETVAFLEIDGFRQSDLDGFTHHFGLPPMHPRVMAGGTIGHVDGEAELDMEVVHEIAPGARLALYNCSSPCSAADVIDLENRMVSNDPGDIISISIGGCEAAEGASSAQGEANAFSRADALGESVLVASGDSGAFTCLSENWGAPPSAQYVGVSMPAAAPGVTGVGGTRLSLTAGGLWYREEAWQNSIQTAGSGGGVSTLFTRPSWQTGPGVANRYNGGLHREVPDVSADADVLTSATIDVNGNLVEEGGTSQAAPIWAGMTALIDQYLHRNGSRSAGFLNPALYHFAATKQTFRAFHDVVTGTNLVYPATPGYDLATGLGSPDAWNLARDFRAYLPRR